MSTRREERGENEISVMPVPDALIDGNGVKIVAKAKMQRRRKVVVVEGVEVVTMRKEILVTYLSPKSCR